MLKIFYIDLDRIAEYGMKLMDIDSDTLSMPEAEYEARVTMTSSDFTRIVRDLSQLGENVRIEANREGVRFANERSLMAARYLDKIEDGEEAERSTSEKEKKKVKEGESDDVELVGGDGDKEDDAEFKPESDEDEGEEEKDDDEEK